MTTKQRKSTDTLFIFCQEDIPQQHVFINSFGLASPRHGIGDDLGAPFKTSVVIGFFPTVQNSTQPNALQSEKLIRLINGLLQAYTITELKSGGAFDLKAWLKEHRDALNGDF